jgi:hypothetical protein
MTYEYTYLWWEGSTTNPELSGPTTPPISEDVIDKINSLAAEGWELDQITAAPLITGWISPRGRSGIAGLTDRVHYLATLKRARSQEL